MSTSERDDGSHTDSAAEVIVWCLDDPRHVDDPLASHRELVGARGRVTASAVSDEAVVACTPSALHVWEPPEIG